MDTISIIIPAYNVEKWITRCLKSVSRQIFDANILTLECIIINDGSKDGTECNIKAFIHGYTGDIIFRHLDNDCNKGQSYTRNRGIKEAVGKYIYFLDADDEISPDCIYLLYKVINKNPDIDFVRGRIKEVGRSMEGENRNRFLFWDASKDLPEDIMPQFGTGPTNKLIRRSLLIEHQIYFNDYPFCEDIYWSSILFSYVRKIAFINEYTYIYYTYNDGGLSSIGHKNERDYNLNLVQLLDDLLNSLSHRQVTPAIDFLISETFRLYKNAMIKLILLNTPPKKHNITTFCNISNILKLNTPKDKILYFIVRHHGFYICKFILRYYYRLKKH